MERIKAAVPELNNEVQRVLEDTEQRLIQLGTAPPETPKARRVAANAIITEIVRNLRHAFTQVDSFTEESGTSVIRQERHVRKNFAAAVLATKPAFDEGAEFQPGTFVYTVNNPAGLAERSVPDSASSCTSEPTVNHAHGTTVSGHLRKRGESGDWFVQLASGGWLFETREQSPTLLLVEGVSIHDEYRRKLCTQIEEQRSRELPGFMSWHLFCSLVCNYVEKWRAPTFAFQQAVRESTVNATRTFIQHAEHFPHLHAKMDALLDAYFEDTIHAATSQLDRLLNVEKAPSTENHYLWDTINKIRNDRMEKQIMAMSDALVYDASRTQVKNYVKKTEVTAMLKSTLSGNTSNESQEVQDMLDMLSAYWKVAAKRYIDEVCVCDGIVFHPNIGKHGGK